MRKSTVDTYLNSIMHKIINNFMKIKNVGSNKHLLQLYLPLNQKKIIVNDLIEAFTVADIP
jgi:hypothetical protein